MLADNKQEEPNDAVKKRAIKRVGVAAVIALVAAIGLTMMSRQKPPPAPAAKPEQTVLPAEPPASAVQAMEPPAVSAVAEATPEPEHDAAPTVAAPPPPPQVVNAPQASGASSHKTVKPAAAKPLREKEPEAAAAPISASAPPAADKSGKPRAAPELVPMAAPAAKEATGKPAEAAAKSGEAKRSLETQKAPEPAKAAPSAPPPAAPASQPPAAKGYAVQLGVFSNPANATQMQEKLSQHGIQSYTETRLNVGPFKNKAEADQALTKVRELGIGAVVVPIR